MASTPSLSPCGDLDPTQQPDSSTFSNPVDVLRLSLAPCERFRPPTWRRLPWSQIVDHAEDAAEQNAPHPLLPPSGIRPIQAIARTSASLADGTEPDRSFSTLNSREVTAKPEIPA